MGFSTNRYLYALRTLHEKYLCVRAVDVAHYLGFAKPSVSISIRQMREQGLIEVEPDGNILFTESGKARAESLNRRVSFFRQLLTEAGVEPSQALQDAISFAWEMSEAAFEAFRRLYAGALAE